MPESACAKLIKACCWSLLCACLPILIFFEVYSLFWREVSHTATRVIPLLWLGPISALIFITTLLSWLVRPLLGQVVFITTLVFSLWTLKLMFLAEFNDWGQFSQFFLLGTLGSIGLIAIRRLSAGGALVPVGTGILAILIFVTTPILTSTSRSSERSIISVNQENQNFAPDLSAFSEISLLEKPNIYVLLYDSLIPPEVATLFFGSESAPYEATLQQYFIQPEGLTAQNDVPPTRSTKHSIRSVMWLDTGGAKDHDYFNGVQDSPLSSLFMANNYEVYTGYVSTFWGDEIGSHISDYLHLAAAPLKLEETTLCIDVGDDLIGSLRGFGICKVLGPFSVMPSAQTAFAHLTGPIEPTKKRRGEDWHRVIENHIRMSAYSDTPHFSFFYTFTPIGHAKTAYDHAVAADREQYVEHFTTRSPLARLVIEDIVKVIKEADNNAIVLVAGDHGTLISKKRRPDDPFSLVDRHLISIGLMRTENRCVKKHQQAGFIPNKGGYHTISSALLSVVACLANDKSIPDKLPTLFRREFSGARSLEEFVQQNIDQELRATFPD